MWITKFYGYFQIVFLCLSLSYIVYNEKLNRLLKPITYIGAVFVEKTNRTQFIMLMYNILFIESTVHYIILYICNIYINLSPHRSLH